jgi:hypothetical protein
VLRESAHPSIAKQNSCERNLLRLFFFFVVVFFVKIILEVILVEFFVVVLVDVIVVVIFVVIFVVNLVIIDASTGNLGFSMTIDIFIAFGAAGQLHFFHFLAAVIVIAQIATHLPAPSLRRSLGARSRASIRACERPAEGF